MACKEFQHLGTSLISPLDSPYFQRWSPATLLEASYMHQAFPCQLSIAFSYAVLSTCYILPNICDIITNLLVLPPRKILYHFQTKLTLLISLNNVLLRCMIFTSKFLLHETINSTRTGIV